MSNADREVWNKNSGVKKCTQRSPIIRHLGVRDTSFNHEPITFIIIQALQFTARHAAIGIIIHETCLRPKYVPNSVFCFDCHCIAPLSHIATDNCGVGHKQVVVAQSGLMINKIEANSQKGHNRK